VTRAVEAVAIELPRDAGSGGAVAMLRRLIGPLRPASSDLAALDLGGVVIRETRDDSRLALVAGVSIVAPTGSAFDETSVPVSSDLALSPCPLELTAQRLSSHVLSVDHVGVNLAARDIDDRAWRAFVAALASAQPAYRLQIESPNEIVIVLPEPPQAAAHGCAWPALELVLDRTIDSSRVHVCLRVSQDRSALEEAFPAPYGGYKRGDEAYFRSIAPAHDCPLPLYLDLAYAGAAFPPWAQIVQAIGRRLA
jgi:hypothetical protein